MTLSAAQRAANQARANRPLFKMGGFAGTLRAGQVVFTVADDPDYVWKERFSVRTRVARRIPLKQWKKPRLIYKKIASRPDIGWESGRGVTFVSTRFRELMEACDPGGAQFLPVSLDGPKRDTLGTWWAVNWLRLWDCQPNKEDAYLDARRVPDGAMFGIVKGDGWWYGRKTIATRDFKLACEAADIIGVRFEPAQLRLPPTAKVRITLPRSRKRIEVERQHIPSNPQFDAAAFLKRFPGNSYSSSIPGASAVHEYVMMHSVMGGVQESELRLLLEAGYSFPRKRSVNLSPIAVSIQPKSPGILKLLHKYGADWNAPTVGGHTALLSAAADLHTPAVKCLIELGADLKHRDRSGQTAAHKVADAGIYSGNDARGALATMRVLAKAGCPLTTKDRQGKAPLDLLDAGLAERSRAVRKAAEPLRRMLGASATIRQRKRG